MSERIEVRNNGPKPRLIEHIVAVIVRGGLIAYPTDSGYALGWRGKIRDERLREILLSDPHSPGRYRVTGALKNMQEFYAAYDVKEGDDMYLPPSERVKIW